MVESRYMFTFHRGSVLDMSWFMPSYLQWFWVPNRSINRQVRAWMTWVQGLAAALCHTFSTLLKASAHHCTPGSHQHQVQWESPVNPESREESSRIAVFDVDYVEMLDFGKWQIAQRSLPIVYTKKLQTAYCNIQIIQFNRWVPWRDRWMTSLVQRCSHPLITVGCSGPRLTLHTNHSLPLPHPALRPRIPGSMELMDTRHFGIINGNHMGHTGM